jgi:hypothetical protein
MTNYWRQKVRRRGDASFVAISATTVACVGGNRRIRPMHKKDLHEALNKFSGFCLCRLSVL